MDSKTTSIVGYLTWIGFIVAMCAGTKDEKSKQHLNNACVSLIFVTAWGFSWLLLIVPIIGWILEIACIFFGGYCLVCLIIGFIMACQEKEFEAPLIVKIKIVK